jgi:hypothetical protein
VLTFSPQNSYNHHNLTLRTAFFVGRRAVALSLDLFPAAEVIIPLNSLSPDIFSAAFLFISA